MKKTSQPIITRKDLSNFAVLILAFFVGLSGAWLFAMLVSYEKWIQLLPKEEFEWLKAIDYKYLVLTIAGQLGGVIDSILLDSKLELPLWSDDKKALKPGFTGEMFVGIVGAFIAYAFMDFAFPNLDLSTMTAVFVTGVIGGYGGKTIIKVAFNRFVGRIKVKEVELEKEALAEEKEVLLEGNKLIDNINQQIRFGLPTQALAELKRNIRGTDNEEARERIFNIAKEVRSIAWKGQVSSLKVRIRRTIPIFEALVASDENEDCYHAQLAYAYKDSDEPNLLEAISQLDQAIKLRGTQIRGNTWKYELNRALSRIFKKKQESGTFLVSKPEVREAILEDFLKVDRSYGLGRVLRASDDDRVDTPIKNWFKANQAWVRTRSDGKALYDKVMVTPLSLETPVREGAETTSAEKPRPAQSQVVAAKERWDLALEKASTTGASAVTARQDRLKPGLESSRKMAQRDLPRIEPIKELFHKVGAKFDVPPAILAALASRESRAGVALDSRGLGDRGRAFGLMQVDRRYHKQAGLGGDPASEKHIEQATQIFASYCQQVKASHPNWGDEYVLKGAAVAYNSGLGNVRTIEGMDRGTTGNDYGSDVIARAQLFTNHLKSLAECKALYRPGKGSAVVPAEALLTIEAIKDALEDVEAPIHISEWNDDLVVAVQAGLLRLKILDAPGDRNKLQRVWAKFKKRTSQGEPELIGPGSAQLLLDRLGVPHPVSDEQEGTGAEDVNTKAGSKTGKSKRLPGYNTLVYENEYIWPGVPLTWGECTKGMNRWPTEKWEVDNAKRLAQVFGEVRKKYGSPIIITSGFRPEAVNRAVHGARYSQHILFKALDLQPTDANFRKLLQALKDTPRVKAIGRGERRGFLHMDIRDNNAPPGFRYSGRQIEFPY